MEPTNQHFVTQYLQYLKNVRQNDPKSVDLRRVQDITKADARAEGMHFGFTLGKGELKYNFSTGAYDAYTANFRRLWDAINARRGYGWNINPWIWVIEFKMIEPEITIPG